MAFPFLDANEVRQYKLRRERPGEFDPQQGRYYQYHEDEEDDLRDLPSHLEEHDDGDQDDDGPGHVVWEGDVEDLEGPLDEHGDGVAEVLQPSQEFGEGRGQVDGCHETVNRLRLGDKAMEFLLERLKKREISCVD
jgi:hypothetical protein